MHEGGIEIGSRLQRQNLRTYDGEVILGGLSSTLQFHHLGKMLPLLCPFLIVPIGTNRTKVVSIPQIMQT